LSLGIGPKNPGFQGNGIAGGTAVLIRVNESRSESLGGEGAGGLVLGEAEAVVTASEHVEQGVADVFGEFPVHGPAVFKLMARERLPNAVRLGGGSPTPGIDLAQGRAVGIFAIRISGIDSAGPLHHFRGRASHCGGSIGGGSHLPESVRVHAQPVEDGSNVHVGPQFSARVVDVAGLVSKDHRIVDTLLSPKKVVVDGHVHGAGRRLEPHFRLVAPVVGGVHGQGIDGVRQGGAAGAVKVKVTAPISSGQEVRSVVGKIRNVTAGLIDGEGNDAVRQDHGTSVVRDRDIGSRSRASTRHIGLGGLGGKEKSNPQ
jgi:hypothetical protein